MYRKRGALLVVVILLISIVAAASALAELVGYQAVQMEVNCDDEEECAGKSVHLDEYGSIGDMKEGKCDEADEGEIPESWPPDGEGCYFVVREKDDYDPDDCDYTTFLPGFNVDEVHRTTGERREIAGTFYTDLVEYVIVGSATAGAVAAGGAALSSTVAATLVALGLSIGPVGWVAIGLGAVGLAVLPFTSFGDDIDAKIALQKVKFNFYGNRGVLCGNDKLWKACDTNTVGKLYYVNAPVPLNISGEIAARYVPSLIYECTKIAEGQFAWRKKQGFDLDVDGYLNIDDDCSDYGYLDTLLGCPSLDESQYQGKTQLEVRQAAKEICAYPQYSQCSICINPHAPEVCGDNVNNDCGGPRQKEAVTELGGITSDNCHNNRNACEKKKPIVDESIPEDQRPPEFNNVNNQFYSWLETGEGEGYCCGYEGASDLGRIQQGWGGQSGNHICLNKQESLVKTAQGDPSQIGATWDLCQGDWCWVAASGNAKFNVYTIKDPGEEAYDVLADGRNWLECKERTSAVNTAILNDFELIKSANRFSCYQEGNRWVWADCPQQEEAVAPDNGIKKRTAGEGNFKLTPQPSEDSSILFDTNSFRALYGQEYLDFTGYDQMEFLIKYTSPRLDFPARVLLRIWGPPGDTQPLYLEENVLTHAVNNPELEPGRTIHVKVPLPAVNDVYKIRLDSEPADNQIAVSSVFLSKKNTNPPICSGKLSVAEGKSAWLENIDLYDSINRNAEHICKARYGENAWLGKDVDSSDARCCGNEAGEYYSGNSENKHGCWNSQPIAPDGTTMNVQFEVSYTTVNQAVVYGSATTTITVQNNTMAFELLPGAKQAGDVEYELAQYVPTEFDKIFFVKDTNTRYSLTQQPGSITYPSAALQGNMNLKVGQFSLSKERFQNPFNNDPYGSVTVTSGNPSVHAYFINPLQPETQLSTITYNTIPQSNTLFYVMAELANTQPTVTPQRASTTQPYSYSCSKAECIYPLAGTFPYTITNPNPHLYELYFLNAEGKEVAVGSQRTFNEMGNIKVRNVAQQILFVNDESERFDRSFYGCQFPNAEAFAARIPADFANAPYCTAKGDKFCSYSTTTNGITTINSWSGESLTHLGYEQLQEQPRDPSALNLQLKALAQPISAAGRNQSSSAVPGRNIIPNAEFKTDGQQIAHWNILDANGLVIENQFARSQQAGIPNAVKLQEGELLISERIAVPAAIIMDLSIAGDCASSATIVLADFLGNTQVFSPGLFNTGQATNAIIQFVGPCTATQPLLQIIDAQGNASYNYQSQHALLQDFDQRAGVSCCPKDNCWNGYACVEPMGTMTYLTEHIGEGRDYRCIEGQWQSLPLQFDWNGEQWGFCSQPGQCFVLSSLAQGADASKTVADFYAQEGRSGLPVCLNDKEYLFDHYCENGNWTSRTKYLAGPLLNVTAGSDYVLYCSSIQDALVEFESQGLYLGLEKAALPVGNQSLFAALQGEGYTDTCFTLPEELYGHPDSLFKKGENTCVNNICVLMYKDGSRSKTAFATTLNRNISDVQKSFLFALGIDHNVCLGDVPGEFSRCENLPVEGDLWYSSDLNALIYAKDGIDLRPGFFARLWDAVLSFFGFGEEIVPGDVQYVSDAGNFRDMYLLRKGDRSVHALKEVSSQERMLQAEYTNFNTSICEYLTIGRIELPADVQRELLPVAAGKDVVNCMRNGSVQRVTITSGLEYFWPQLTGRLRVS